MAADRWFDCDRFDAYKALGTYLGGRAVDKKRALDGMASGGRTSGAEAPGGGSVPVVPTRVYLVEST